MELREISDRLEIQDLLARYSFAIDDRNWDALDRVFTADAWIDYRQTGGAAGRLPEIKRWLAAALARFPRYQHLVATTMLTIGDDSAAGRTILFNPMVYRGDDDVERSFFIGLWYRDRFVRTVQGWRIAERVEEMSWTHDVPEMPPIPSLAEV